MDGIVLNSFGMGGGGRSKRAVAMIESEDGSYMEKSLDGLHPQTVFFARKTHNQDQDFGFCWKKDWTFIHWKIVARLKQMEKCLTSYFWIKKDL